MPYSTTFLQDGDDVDAASVNQGFTDAQAWINALGPESSRRGTFNHFQGGYLPQTFAPGVFTKAGGDSGTMIYDFAVFMGVGGTIDYVAYGTDGGSELAGQADAGDRAIVGHPDCGGAYSDGLAKITYATGFRVGMTNGDLVAAAMVFGNLQFRLIDRGQTTGLEALLCVQYQLDSTGDWYTIDESERFVSLDDHRVDPASQTEFVDFDIPVVTLITPDVVLENGNPVTDRIIGVRLMTSIYGGGAPVNMVHQRWRLTVLPLYASLVVVP